MRQAIIASLLGMSILVACGSKTNDVECGPGTVLVGKECLIASPEGVGGAAPVCADPIPIAASDLLITDFEDGFAPGWGAFNDGNGTQFGTGVTPEAELLDVPRGNSRYAANTWGTGFNVWGAGIQRWYGPPCRSVSAFDGFSFWARSTVDLRVAALTPETEGVDAQGDCLTACYDHYGAFIAPSVEWRFYAFRWTDLSQAGSGTPVTFSKNLLGIAFMLPRPSPTVDSAFDYWIDDVSYFIGTTPTDGAGGTGAGGSGP